MLAARPQLVCVAGGSGFVGRELVNRLVRAGHSVRVLTRHEAHAAPLRVPGRDHAAHGVADQYDGHCAMGVAYENGHKDTVDPEAFTIVNGKLYGRGDGEMVVPSHRWGEYTRNLRKLHMSEAAFNRSGSGEVYIGSQTFGVGGIRSYYGYVYCPEPSTILRSYLPCTEGNDSGGWSSFRYERLDRNWYIYKVSGPYYIE